MASTAFPTATYRLQFRNGMTFSGAREILPHLVGLGVSHLYASPIFTAANGSTHGYDVADCNEIDPELGGEAGFVDLVEGLRAAGLGLILDIVPNHMSSGLKNRWWRDVIEWGEASPFAGFFDIDWQEPLTLPFLGAPFEEVAAQGEIVLTFDPAENRLCFSVYGQAYPLTPASWDQCLSRLPIQPARRLERLSQDAACEKWAEQRKALEFSRQEADELAQALEALSADKQLLSRLHEAQAYRLVDWRLAKSHLTYRRFFEVTELVGLRVEDEKVFGESHRLVLDLVSRGLVQGLRLDHIDGLADPAAYLARLRQAVGPDIYIVVEKILDKNETLPASWPVQGTTGYEFSASIADALVCPDGLQRLQQAFAMLGASKPYAEQLLDAKDQMLSVNFAGEVDYLARLARTCCPPGQTCPPLAALQAGICALVRQFPVYRTYADRHGMEEGDEILIDEVAERARSDAASASGAAISQIIGLMKGEAAAHRREEIRRFRARFQQLTGPIMAKSLEDTLFYRFNALIALNEVGGDPEKVSGLDSFHSAMQQRVETAPHALLASSTHDTKRGEDARARLFTLSEAPEAWLAAFARWRERLAGEAMQLPDGVAPEPQVEWLMFQSLLGMWPLPAQLDEQDEQGVSQRFSAYLSKALREAKQRTNWGDENEAYEKAVLAYANGLFEPRNADVLADFKEFAGMITASGMMNSLSQTLIKLTAPGIPDIYQGSEWSDFSLVDPDNRREVAFAAPPRTAPPATADEFAAYKAWMIARVLALRRDMHPELFTQGSYRNLSVEGPAACHVIAFERMRAGESVIVLAPRLTLGCMAQEGLLLDPALLSASSLTLPQQAGAKGFQDIFSAERVEGPQISLSTLMQTHPVALLRACED
ncbi:malto-oligosyltrehalose synthase [Allorhizobium undicola]|uniref:malto-oligosyltrehalose synthase n=1 Tax=Allorhizobium undicola TaxID=78527 RepID=UPI003D3574A7